MLFCLLLLCIPQGLAIPLERYYALDSIGYLKPTEPLEGLLANSVLQVYQEYFSTRDDFTAHDLSRLDSTLKVFKIPYTKIIQDTDILRKISKLSQSETLLRTQIKRKLNFLEFQIDWLHAPEMHLLASTQFSLPIPPPGTTLDHYFLMKPLFDNLHELFQQVPFLGRVTGRNQHWITINLGSHSSLKVGDILTLGSLKQVKKHPLLHSIVEWKTIPLGKITVKTIHERISFCQISEESEKTKIENYQKILNISSPVIAPVVKAQLISKKPEPIPFNPQLGELFIELPLGLYQWEFNSPVNQASFAGEGFAFGGKVGTQLWLNRHWFSDIKIKSLFWRFSQQNTQTDQPSLMSTLSTPTGSLLSFQGSLGYSYLFHEEFFGPKVWAQLGYKTEAYQLPISKTEWTGPLTIQSFLLGLGFQLPIVKNLDGMTQVWINLFSQTQQTWLAESDQNHFDLQFYIGATYRLSPRIKVRMGIEWIQYQVQFSQNTSITEKTMTINPQLLYAF